MNTRPAAVLLILPLLAGCATTRPPRGPTVVTTLYFGLGKPDGTMVSPREWQLFADTEIVRNFPNGFTVLSGDGTWDGQGKVEHEPCRVVVIVRADTAEIGARIDAVRVAYCRQFGQQSVLRVDELARRVSF